MEQRITLHDGWNWISFAVDSAGPVATVLASIDGRYDLVLGETGTYAPPPAIQFLNTLATLEPGKGYFIRMTGDSELVLQGSRLPADTPIQLAGGWHWIGYLPTVPESLPGVLDSVAGRYDYLLGEYGTYGAYGPPALNNLAAMEPGRGYLIRMTQSGTIIYPTSGTLGASARPRGTATPSPTATRIPTGTPTATPTGTTMPAVAATATIMATSKPSATPSATPTAPAWPPATTTASPMPTATPSATATPTVVQRR